MSFTVNDPILLAGLRQAGDVVELKDPDGRILGTFAGAELGRLPSEVKSPFSEAVLVERRKNRSGRPLTDILRDLKARG